MEKKYKRRTYPKNYKTIHVRESLFNELNDLYDFGNIGNQEKINQLLRFYKVKKNKNV